MNALEVISISKSFERVKAVQDVSFGVPEGGVFGLLGRNGAGKTTTLRMIMNIYEPDSGDIRFRGETVTPEFNRRVGYLPEERGLYKKMTVLDTLLFFAELKGKPNSDVKDRALDYLKHFDLYDRRSANVEDLSKGNQQKIQFISTILHDPEFLILDEPFSGLDPINTNIFKDIILDLKRNGKVIIFSTHLMEFAEQMCDSLAIIHKGELLEHGTMSDVKAKYSENNITLVHEGDVTFLENMEGIESIQNIGNSMGIRVKNGDTTQAILQELVKRNVTVKKFDANDISLHEIFVSLTLDDVDISASEMEAAHV